MEQSEQFDNVLALGKRLVQELNLVGSVDTLGRWMAHYISELIVEAEVADGEKKKEIQAKCQKEILNLWKHIEVFPGEARPFRDMEPIVATIRALNSGSSEYFLNPQAQTCIDQSQLSDEAKQWLNRSRLVDNSARLMIKLCLAYATDNALKECQEWDGLSEKADAERNPIIDLAQTIEKSLFRVNSEKNTIEMKIDSLNENREQLKSIIEIVELLVSEFDSEISKLNL